MHPRRGEAGATHSSSFLKAVSIGHSGNTILAPAEGPRPSVVVAEICEGGIAQYRHRNGAGPRGTRARGWRGGVSWTYDSRHRRRHCSPHGLGGGQHDGYPRREARSPTCSPLPLGNVGTPFLPVLDAIAVLLQTLLLLGEVLVAVEHDHVAERGGRTRRTGGWRGGGDVRGKTATWSVSTTAAVSPEALERQRRS